MVDDPGLEDNVSDRLLPPRPGHTYPVLPRHLVPQLAPLVTWKSESQSSERQIVRALAVSFSLVSNLLDDLGS